MEKISYEIEERGGLMSKKEFRGGAPLNLNEGLFWNKIKDCWMYKKRIWGGGAVNFEWKGLFWNERKKRFGGLFFF